MKNKFFISKQYNHLVGAVHWREMRWKRHKRYFFNRNKKKGKWKEETKSIFKCRCFWWHESIRDERGRRVCGMKQSIHELLKHVQMKGRNEWTYRQFTIRLYRMRYKLTFFFLLRTDGEFQHDDEEEEEERDEGSLRAYLKDVGAAENAIALSPLTLETTPASILKHTTHCSCISPCIDSWLHHVCNLQSNKCDTMINFYFTHSHSFF